LRKIRVEPNVLVKNARKFVKVNLQKTRLKLLRDLEEMFDMAKGFASGKDSTPKQRQTWMRIMAYIGQVINSISKSFDEAQITQDLEKLERMINEAMAKEKDRGIKGASRGSDSSQEAAGS